MKAFYLPFGTANLSDMFPGIDWENISEFYIEAIDVDDNVQATSPIQKLCTCEGVRVHFLNYLGAFDTVNFLQAKITHEDQSAEFKKLLSFPLAKTDTGTERFNVRSNDTYEVRRKCKENEMEWLQECADSPKMFIEWIGTEGQSSDYLPVIKIGSKFEKLKNEKQFQYDFVIEFKLSNDFINIRN